LRNGVDFLGFHTYLTETGKVIRKLRQNSKNRMRRKIKKFKGLHDTGKITLEAIDHSFQSWLGHASHGNCYRLIKKMNGYYQSVFKEDGLNGKGNNKP